MAQKAFRERLREIDMSEFDAVMYEKYAGNVRRQVKSLRVLLESLQVRQNINGIITNNLKLFNNSHIFNQIFWRNVPFSIPSEW